MKVRTKLEAVFIVVWLVVISVGSAWAVTRTLYDRKETISNGTLFYSGNYDFINNSHFNLSNKIYNSKGHIWNVSASNIQLAIFDLNNTNGGTVQLPTCSLSIPDNLTFISNLIFKGNGIGNTILIFGTHNALNRSTFFDIKNEHDIHISDMTINGNKGNQGAGTDTICTINISYSKNITIEYLQILYGWTESIRTYHSKNVVIKNCNINNSADDSIAINELSEDVIVDGNFINNTGVGLSYGAPYGIEVQDGCQKIIAINNIINNSKIGGIAVTSHAGLPVCNEVRICNNIISNLNPAATSIGIVIEGVITGSSYISNVSVSGNIINIHNYTGIYLHYCNGTTTEGNYIESGLNNIYISLSDNVIIKGNTIVNGSRIVSPKAIGVVLTSTTKFCVIKDNIFENICIGIMQDGRNNSIIGNYIFDKKNTSTRALEYGIYDTGKNTTIKDNIVRWARTFDYYSSTSSRQLILIGNIGKKYYFQGTISSIRNNIGYVTENWGNTTVSNNSTISHGLASTPIVVLLTSNYANLTFMCMKKSSTTFTVIIRDINTHTTPSGSYYVMWYAKV